MSCADAEHRNTRKDKLKENKKHPYKKLGGHGCIHRPPIKKTK